MSLGNKLEERAVISYSDFHSRLKNKVPQQLTFWEGDWNDDTISCANPQTVAWYQHGGDTHEGEAQFASTCNEKNMVLYKTKGSQAMRIDDFYRWHKFSWIFYYSRPSFFHIQQTSFSVEMFKQAAIVCHENLFSGSPVIKFSLNFFHQLP